MGTTQLVKRTLSQIAEQYLGKTETPNNSGFTDKTFEKRMKDVGWAKSQAWCAYFAELCVLEWANEIGRKDIATLATKLFSGGSTATFKSFDMYATANPTGIVKISKKPLPNSIAIYRHGSGWMGHTAIVASVEGSVANNIEGNTNNLGGREGIVVARKRRDNNAPYSAKGLNIVGYFYFV
jgi:hypothetical protein